MIRPEGTQTAGGNDAARGAEAGPGSDGASAPGPPLVSICILVLSDPQLAIGCLDSLATAELRSETEAVVVANGTPGRACEALEERTDIVLVRSATNLGFGGGNNLAAQIARGRYLFFVNDDSTVATDCIAQLLATMGLDSAIGAVGCRILSTDGSLQEAGSALWSDGSTEHVGLGLPAGSRRYSYVRDVDYASANGLMVSRSAWDAVGGFDERYYPAYYEDVDLCMALRAHGFRVVYEPRARVCHLESQSTTDRYRKFLLDRNRRLFVAKWEDALADLQEPPRVLDAAAFARAVHWARGSPRRLLLYADGTPPRDVATMVHAVEEVTGRGWAVTLVSSITELGVGSDTGTDSERSSVAGRLADRGVDVRNDVSDVLATEGTEWEAVAVASPARWREDPIIRPDGRVVPVVTFPVEDGAAALETALETALEAALAPVGSGNGPPPPGRPSR